MTVNQTCNGSKRVFLGTYCGYLIMNFGETLYHRWHPIVRGPAGDEIAASTGTGKFLRVIRRLCKTYFVVCIIFGTFSLFSVDDCKQTSPLLYWTALVASIYLVLIVFLPIILLTMLICCLPCVIAFASRFYPEPERGAPEDIINSIQTSKYDPAVVKYGNVTIQPEDATCSICLQDYTAEAQLRITACRHHFHQVCVDEWFRLQASCPLCKTPIYSPPSSPNLSPGYGSNDFA